MNKKITGFLFGLFACILLVSCASQEKARYFEGVPPTEYRNLALNYEPVIRKGDILSIAVSSANPEASAIYNSPITSIPSTDIVATINQVTGYLVNQEGKITFPVLGEIQASGLTKKQLADSIVSMILNKKLLVDPIVIARIMNYRVTVLGEVAKPGVISVPNEKISILEAFGFAGDLTLFAKRDNIMVIREEEGKKVIRRINLNNDEIFRSPYYYLKSNDVVYVESNRAKVKSTSRGDILIPVIMATLTFLTIVIDRTVH
ncbi:polysaccharide biosynthesis/export family protein [Flavihumibacter profundi]|uniref:polysaccharide biosynthesis/export family protein n=1 Tax=Flavihumibacter profundi TaxID=2716883 RepID=UPI001CC40F72|nr:polysaccharide biosynthesis/export family protein [Flavihumibacter profundi]MBZ5855764.1 polysaccharide biosynthesis/export family protein [Flavihumibacter profundi]